MGLDQYAYYQSDETKDLEEFFYWRKHNRLQGWMGNLFREKGGEGEFNCKDLELTIEDLNKLEQCVRNKKLPQTEGFFFGNDSYEYYDEEFLERDLKFITEAKEYLNSGVKVFYSCWY